MNKKLILLAIALFTATRSFCAEPPRLIVQIVVGSMRAEDLGRYAANFGEGGFRRLMQGGTVYTGAFAVEGDIVRMRTQEGVMEFLLDRAQNSFSVYSGAALPEN